jgi:solute carrier family 25 phosphate transporter 23/24/25/41
MQRKQTAKRLFAGGFAGALSRSMVAPLERLRTIMMASPVPITMRTAVEQMWNDGGAAGLFKGNMASVIKVLPSSAVQFAVYDHCSDAFKALRGLSPSSTPHIGDRLAAGVVAGAAACVVTYPLDTIRTMMCVPGVATGNFFRVRTGTMWSCGLPLIVLCSFGDLS